MTADKSNKKKTKAKLKHYCKINKKLWLISTKIIGITFSVTEIFKVKITI